MTEDKITGIVLAGGKSSRMGHDKALIVYHGKPLIQHAVDLLSRICTKVIISANSDAYSFTGCEILPDGMPVDAPMTGIFSGIHHSDSEWNIVLSCDMPLVERWFIVMMLQHKDGYDTVVPVHDNGTLEPLCAVYHRNTGLVLEKHLREGQYSIRQFILESNHNYIETGINRYMFLNVNTAEDFILLNKS